MARVDVVREFVNQVAPVSVIPHVMMWIDNRQIRLKRILVTFLRPIVELDLPADNAAAKFGGIPGIVGLSHIASPNLTWT